jgi:predicted nucleotidyltransferase
MKFGITKTTLQKLEELFSRNMLIDKVIIYGSRAKGNYREGSDIDLALVGEGLDSDVLLSIKNELEDLLLPYKIDLSIFEDISNEELLEHIKRVGQLFYQKEINPSNQ